MNDNIDIEWWRRPGLEFGLTFALPQISYIKKWLFDYEYHWINNAYQFTTGGALCILGLEVGAAISWLKLK